MSRLASDADVDALTGQLNRRGFDRAVKAEITRAARTGSRLALILLNVDRFVAINDQYGYRAGDQVLQQLVGSWLEVLEPRQILARYGGDEFAVLLPGSTEQGAITLTERLRATMSMGCSAGVTLWQPGESASSLVSRADAGLYRAKQAGRNRTVLESSRRPPLALELADAIADETLEVLYQPIVSLAEGGTIVGLEALVRWKSADRPDVTPEEVIRVAEENDLIASLDLFVLRRACLDASSLQQAMLDGLLTLNVNVSGLELVELDCVAHVDEVLQATGWPARQLVLEVTEACSMWTDPPRSQPCTSFVPVAFGSPSTISYRLLVAEQNQYPADRLPKARQVVHRGHHVRIVGAAAAGGHRGPRRRTRSAGDRRGSRKCIPSGGSRLPR